MALPKGAFAQVDEPAVELPELAKEPSAVDTGIVIPALDLAPLDTLIARALDYSPSLGGQDEVIKTKVLDRKVQRLDWLKMARAYGGTAYGNGQIVNSSTDGTSAINTLAIRQDLFYSVGVNLTISPYEWLTRNENTQMMDAEIYRARFDKMVLEDQIAEEVIARYQDLMLAVEVQRIRAINLQTHRINIEIAEKYFQTGDLPFSEYSRTLESRMQAELDFRTSQIDVKRAYLMLESIVGHDLH